MSSKFIHHLNLMLWKDFRIVKNHKFQFTVSIFLPLLLGVIGVGLRLTTDVQNVGLTAFSPVNLQTSFKRLLRIITERRTLFEALTEGPYHSVYCPQLIIAFAAVNAKKFEDIQKFALTEMQPWGVRSLFFSDCDEMKANMVKEHYLYSICFHNTKHRYDLYYDIIVSGELRDYNVSYISDFWYPSTSKHLNVNPREYFLFGTEGGVGAVREGVAYIQNIIAIKHMKSLVQNFKYTNIRIARLPNVAAKYDPLVRNNCIAITSIILLGYLFPSVFIITMLVNEKEFGVRNYLSGRGISVPVQLMAWGIILWFITAFNSIIVIILFKIAWNNGSAIVNLTGSPTLCLFLLSYCFANTGFCVMISAVCSSKHKAIPFLTLVWLLSFIMHLHNKNNNPFAEYFGVFLFLTPNCNTANFLRHVLLEDAAGIQTHFFELINFGRHSETFYTLLFSTILFYIIACGLDKFKPGLYGEPLRLRKLFKKKKRTGTGKFFHRKSLKAPKLGERFIPSTNLNPTVNLISVTKSFGKQILFQNLFLSMYANEIVVCVGANGSGKSALSLLIGGLMSFDSGSIKIHDIDLEQHKKEALDDVGIAAGSQLMLPHLTFMEQLIFYSRVNGVRDHYSWNYANNFSQKLLMEKYQDVMTKDLPLTAKRILAVMCAFAGNKSIIILDSIDNIFLGNNGTKMCKFINASRDKRTILITTSSTEVAAFLSTRLFFLHSGNILSHGNVDLLKEAFGQEIVLSCFKTRHLKPDLIAKMIQESIPNIIIDSNEMSPEVVFRIEKQDHDKIPSLLNKLEDNRKEFGLEHFYLRQLGLGDLFKGVTENRFSATYDESEHEFKINRLKTDTESEKTLTYNTEDNILSLLKNTPKVTGFKLFYLRVEALLRKQYYSHSINKFTLIFYMLIPLIICLFALILLKLYLREMANDPRVLSITEYKKAFTLVSSTKKLNNEQREIISSYHKEWLDLPSSKYYYVDLIQQNIIDFIHEKSHFGHKMEHLLVGMHVGANSIIARFGSDHLHTAQTSLSQIHNAILRTILRNRKATIQATLSPLPTELNNLRVEVNVMRFLSFCLSLGLWFVFGLSTTGISFDRSSFSAEHQNTSRSGFAFWIGYFIVIIAKLLIVIPIILIFLFSTDYRIYMSSRMTLILIQMIVLGAIYFQFVKMIIFILFYEIEKNYIITLFLTIVSIIAYNFAEIYFSKTISVSIYLMFLPLNIIARLIFLAFFVESTKVMCMNDSVYYISVYAEKCKQKPNCCVTDQSWGDFRKNSLYLVITIAASISIAVVLAKVYRVTQLYSCKKIPLIKPQSNRRSSVQEDPVIENRSRLLKTTLVSFNPRSDTLDTLAVFFDNVGKQIKNRDVVNNVSFILKRGECFGLIGPHNQDKQMLLRLMSGNIRQSYGRIFCFGETAIPHFCRSKKVTIGYCLPEFGRVHFYKVGKYMEIHALAVGIPKKYVQNLCRKLAEYIDILEDYDKIIAIVSSTTKLRMAFITAFIGFPQLALVDISMADLDYKGKNLMLKLVQWYLNNQGTVVLSVPSQSNGVLFATRLGLLVNGRMKAIGSLGTICERFAHGYQLVSKIKPTSLTGGRINLKETKLYEHAYMLYCTFIESRFHSAIYQSQSGKYIFYFIPYETTSFAEIYTVLEENKKNLSISEYYITQNTLDFVTHKLIGEAFPKEADIPSDEASSKLPSKYFKKSTS